MTGDSPVGPGDEELLERDPASERYVDEHLLDARAAFRSAVGRLGTILDDRLPEVWRWRAGEPHTEDGEVDRRYAFYRVYERLEAAIPLVDPTPSRPAARWLGAATAARWDLHGLLASIDDRTLDRDPGGGEWTVRQTLAHAINSQRAYGWFTAWWLGQRDNDDPALQIPGEVEAPFPDEADESPGRLDELGRRLDGVLDASAARFRDLDEAALSVRARWSGYPVDIRFRLGRWSSHLREHTIQVEKTLVMLDHHPTESQRLVRLTHGAWGRLEAAAFATGSLHGDARRRLADAVAEIGSVAADAVP